MPWARKAALDHIDARTSRRKRGLRGGRGRLNPLHSEAWLDYEVLGVAMTTLDRAALIDLLDRLGSADDAAVLEAARALHRKAAESGLSWDDLIRLDEADDEAADEGEEASPPSPGTDETTRLIERLLRKGVSEALREDLTDMKRQLADGSLDQEDRRYVRALAKRLGV